MKNLLFVCLGNICRSPMAEAIMHELLKEHPLHSSIRCDSAGTIHYHIGRSPDYRTIKVLESHKIKTLHKGRLFKEADFKSFDFIFVMDRSNLHDILLLAKSESDVKKVRLIRDFDDTKPDDEVPDPYYGKIEDFVNVYEILTRCCRNILDDLSLKP